MIAALFVETNGCYFNVDGVDPWDINRDARKYAGPWPVVAHPPCERWGRYWHGSPLKPHQYKLGDDNGCFASALEAVRRWGRAPGDFSPPYHLFPDTPEGRRRAVRCGRLTAISRWTGGRAATPPAFRDLLISIARTANPQQQAAA